METRQSRFGVLCGDKAPDPGQPAGPSLSEDNAHTDDVYGRTIAQTSGWWQPRETQAGKCQPGLLSSSFAGEPAPSRATAQLRGRNGRPALTREPGLFFIPPNNPDLLCLLLVTERKEIFISLDTLTAAPHLLERVPFCSAYMGRSPASRGRKRGDFASLPRDTPPQLPDAPQHSPCVLGNQLSNPLCQKPQPAEGPAQLGGRPLALRTRTQRSGCRLARTPGKSSPSETLWGQGPGFLRECEGLLTRVSVSLASEGRASGATSIPATCPRRPLPCLRHSIHALGFRTV